MNCSKEIDKDKPGRKAYQNSGRIGFTPLQL
jgi:hypothetical protein